MSARADDHGCTVLLCLANPAGSMAVAECVAPIKKLHRDLARGRAFPTCDMASAPDTPSGQSWAAHGVSYYDECPMGTTALEAGAYAVGSAGSASYYLGTGEGANRNAETNKTLPNKICVGKRIGDTSLTTAAGHGSETSSAGVLEPVVVIAPHTQPHDVDVYVNSAFSHRVRW
jgi:hypothetical protein